MKTKITNWIWFILIMLLILGAGFYLGKSRRTELGKSFDYSLEDYRKVDPALIHYSEVDPIVPGATNISSLAIAPDGSIYIGAENAIEVVGGKTFPVGGTPTCIAVDDEGTLFVGMQDHVEIYTPGGEKTAWAAPGGKAYLTSVAVDDWYVYVADAGSRRVWRYKKEGGDPLEIGRKDWANDVRGFFIPSPFFDVDIGPDGSLWVVNPGYHALENYRPDGMPISRWEKSSMTIEGFSGCCNPSHFSLMPDGSFVTAEKGLPRVKIHNLDGSLRCVVAAPDQFDEGVVGLDVTADDSGRIYVLDPSLNLVRVFEESK
jgi:hypothetical protein